MSRKKNTIAKQAAASAAATPQDAALAALNADPGPLIVTLAVNRVTGRMGMAGNAASEHDLEIARDALATAQAQVQQQLVAAAEARGKASAAQAEKAQAAGKA